jgi:hypothetical protein
MTDIRNREYTIDGEDNYTKKNFGRVIERRANYSF